MILPRQAALPVLLGWLLVLVLVHLGLFIGAQGLAGAPEGIGLNLRRVLRFGFNTVYVSALAALLATAYATIPALVCARLERGTSRACLLALLAVPLLISPAVYSVVAVHLFGAKGYITDLIYTQWELLRPMRPDHLDPSLRAAPIFTLTGTAFTIAWAYLPVASLVLYAGFQRLDRSQEESARLETSFLSYMLRLLIPSVKPFFLLSFLLFFLLAATEFSIPESLRSQPVLVQEIYTQFGIYYDARTASLAAIAVVIIAFATLCSGWFLLRRMEGDPLQEAESSVEWPPLRNIETMPLRALGWVMALLPMAVVLTVLIATLFGPTGPLAVLEMTWITAQDEFLHTLRLAATAALSTALIGTILGCALASAKRPWPWRFLLLVALLIPGPVTAISFKNCLLQGPNILPLWLDDLLHRLDDSVVPLISAWTVRFSPMVALLVELQLRRVPREQIEAWRLESSNPLTALGTWLLRAISPGLVAGAVATFALSMGEGGAALLLIPPGTTTLSVRILTLMHFAPAGQVSALCLLMTLPALLLFPAILFAVRRIRLAPLGSHGEIPG